MRALAVAGLLLLVAGCLGSGAPAAKPRGEPRVDDAGRAPFQLDAPALPAGRAWTYHVDGVYNVGGENTVVVAKRDGGYLFAGAAQKDVWEAAIWGRAWQGPQDADLNTPEGPRRFDWPLADGKTWAYSKTLNVTARAADVKLPNGSAERGFRIEGHNDKASVAYDYAPSVGFWTTYTSTFAGVAYQHATLTKVAEGVKPLWFEAGPRAGVSESDPPAALQVPDGFDAVLASAGGNAGHTAIVPPGGAPWTWDAGAKESWSYQSWSATQGPWSLASAAPPQGGSNYVAAVAVKWTSP